jgi:hypothetical protein
MLLWGLMQSCPTACNSFSINSIPIAFSRQNDPSFHLPFDSADGIFCFELILIIIIFFQIAFFFE